ncbi:MAG: YdeI/OmpD-associated family protein [Bacteroidota bacterium]
MAQKDKRIDTYIARSQPFARPILKRLRLLVHKACPDVEETMKWSFPHFDYKGEMMCSMAAFKQHCAFGFWKASLLKDKSFIANAKTEKAMGHLGRITSLADLPTDKTLIASIKEAMRLNDAGIKVKKPPVEKKSKNLVVPPQLQAALKKNFAARKVFEEFSYSNKKDYVEWIADAKTDETRARRIDTAVEWLSEGKPRNWKYLRKK